MIDESGGVETKRKKMGVRTAVMSSLDTGKLLYDCLCKGPIYRVKNLGTILRLMINRVCPPSTKKRSPVKVNELADQWIEAIVGMVLAHDKDTYDANDAKADELLGPLLAAPIAQVREFYNVLLAKMKKDKRIPFIVHMGFEAWGEVQVKDAPDEGVKRLKNKLAGEISDLVEMDIRDQIPEAIKRALRWRDPETLKDVKAALEGGAKPKLRGRESCLFLECKPRGKEKVSVML